jgi:hypothetical protein
MPIALDEMADALTISPDDLQRRSLMAFIERERRLAQLDIADLQDRYGVQTPQELARQIEAQLIYAHPAWEELIEWERIENYLAQLDQWQTELEAHDVPTSGTPGPLGI